MDNVASAIVEIRNQLGLHIHPSDLVAKTAVRFLSRVTIACDGNIADARSVVGLTALGAGLGARLTIRAEGPDAEAAVAAIRGLIEGKFGED
jgi:phosphotransferase system HPr (HPr) family protein